MYLYHIGNYLEIILKLIVTQFYKNENIFVIFIRLYSRIVCTVGKVD